MTDRPSAPQPVAEIVGGVLRWHVPATDYALAQHYLRGTHHLFDQAALDAAVAAAVAQERAVPECEDSDAGHLRRQAKRLLEQLRANRPRRALNLIDAQHLLERVAAPADTDKLIADLIRAAWEWGVSCEVDDVSWGESGDSHNQTMRDRTYAIATLLQAQLPACSKTSNLSIRSATPQEPT